MSYPTFDSLAPSDSSKRSRWNGRAIPLWELLGLPFSLFLLFVAYLGYDDRTLDRQRYREEVMDQ